jgi:hypothetical protein
MSTIPLDLERRLEQRWTARCLRPLEPARTPKNPPENRDQQLSAPDNSKRKTRRIEPTGIRSAPRGERETAAPTPSKKNPALNLEKGAGSLGMRRGKRHCETIHDLA